MTRNMLGAYGTWAAGLLARRGDRQRPRSAAAAAAWRQRTTRRVWELLAAPAPPEPRRIRSLACGVHAGVAWERLSWHLPWGPATEAVLLRPADVPRGRPLPGILGLHDHSGNKYFGWRKIAQTGGRELPELVRLRAGCYGGVAWANAAARRGFAVLAHDTFLFGSRRVRVADTPAALAGECRDPAPDDSAGVAAYNRWASDHESIVAKSLFCAGTTWPGVYLREDQAALSVLASRPGVDPSRLACAGLSGGGLRTVYLAGLDRRVRCCACVGFMTTWRDLLLNVSRLHTWMTYLPLAANDLDFPEILALRAPLPALVQCTRQDPLYTLPGMRRAGSILRRAYRSAGASERCRVTFHDGGHQFDRAMQAEAFAWFERWLGPTAG